MDDLIKALQIFRKYSNRKCPTCCFHYMLIVIGINPNIVSTEDKEELEKLGFFFSDEYEIFISFRFGSG